MMALWESQEIAKAVGGAASQDFVATGVAFDSREISDGDLFVALKGEQSDGHLYLDKAIKAGAAGAVVSE
ncbi:Mur ligase domain-containing protein, partial [Parasphingorhabdus sp.]